MTEPLTMEKNAALYPRVQAGDAVAREEMITGNMPLVIAKVESLIRSFPNVEYLRDDLTSAGLLGLTSAVNAIADGFQAKNPTFYLAKAIVTEIGKALEDETPIRIPYTSRRRAETTDTPLVPPVVQNIIPERFEAPSYEKELEMRDVIDACCVRKEERTFVAMKEAGHTLTEIAAAMNMPLTSTHRLAKRLEAHVQRKIKAIRDE
jgi:hypothetical protein